MTEKCVRVLQDVHEDNETEVRCAVGVQGGVEPRLFCKGDGEADR